MLHLRDRLLPLLRTTSPLPSPIHIHSRACRLLSTSPAPFSLEDYLVASCGLVPTQACEVLKKLSRRISSNGSRRSLDELSYSRLNSASNTDAITALLAGVGLSRADIAAVVSADPLLLRASVKNIAPRLLALRDHVGLSALEIARLLQVASHPLQHRDVAPRLEFFISFYGSFEKVLVTLKKCIRLLSRSIERSVKPNIALLRQWGVRDVVQLCSTSPWVLTINMEHLNECLMRAQQQLGVPPTSRMFRHAVAIAVCMSEEKVAAKLEFLKRALGCSESELSTAVSKAPPILGLSNENIRCKVEFLVSEAATEPQYIVERPVLLTMSLKKRLVPRHYVMKLLQEKGLLNNRSFTSLVYFGEETFKLKFTRPSQGLCSWPC